MPQPADIHPKIDIDETVDRTNESAVHWAIKAAIIHRFRTDPAFHGAVEAEKKTSDLIADIRCEFNEAPPETPENCVVEIQTSASNKDLLRTVENHLRHGYAVYWVYEVDALAERKKAEERLTEQMTSTPSFGVAALADGELTLGAPITWDEFEFRTPWLGQHELYVPTYNRSEDWYSHGAFAVDDERVIVYRVAGESELFISRTYQDGQQTIPRRAPWTRREFYKGVESGTIRRVSPVQGPP